MKRLLTIQDVSCVGQCSLTVALPLVSACGVECAVLPSAVLSNHTGGFRGWTFADLTGEMPKVEAKWRELGIGFDAFYTGYVCESQIDPILSSMDSCANPGAVRVIDPVLGDNGRLYAGFAPDFPAKMARLCAGADYILPNQTEAAFLTGEVPKADGYTERETLDIIARLHGLGARNVVLTGVSFDPELIGSAVSDGRTVKYDFNPRLRRRTASGCKAFEGAVFHGTGDIFASVFAGCIMRGRSAFDAAAIAADIVCAAISATEESHWYGVRFERAIPELAKILG